MSKAENCINIGSKWYFVKEFTLINLFFEILAKITELELNINNLKHDEIS